MSLPKKMTVQCSKCGAEIDVTIFESVNTDYSADIPEQIISGNLFNAKCDKCGFLSHLEYDLLYHDVKHGAMIWVLHDNSPEYSSKVAELRSSANILGYKTTRIVNNMNGLRQKVACLENGRDDRIIELCKVFIAYSLMSKQPDFEFNNAFYTNFLDQERVFLYDKNEQELSCELTDDIYSMLSEMYYNSEYVSDFQDYYALVDYDWAESVIQPLLKQEAERIDTKNAASSAPTSNPNTTEEKVVCPKCKQTLPEDSVFCHYCGTSLTAIVPSNKHLSPPVTNTTAHSISSIPKSKKKPIVFGIIIALVVALIIGMVAWIINNNNESSGTNGDRHISSFNNEYNDSLDNWNDTTPSYEDIGVTFEQYTLAEMMSDNPLTYCEYIVELDGTLSKGSYGIDLQKEKATEYVNNLPLDYGQRIILFKIQFPTDTTYCSDIVDYLNGRENISFDEKAFILEELGFAVFEDGTVKW